jgi:hypothetical protein
MVEVCIWDLYPVRLRILVCEDCLEITRL